MVASVFLVFSNSLQFVRIGLVAALWAAAIGALAATKFRKESAVDKAKARDLQTVYELQLEREVTARREYELGVEARVRQEVGADASEMAALRMELTVLRQNLQRLFDGELLVDRPALHADATRIQELERGSADPANNSSANADRWGPHLPHPPRSSVTPVFEPHHPEAPLFASPFDEPVTAETSIVSVEPAGNRESVGLGDSGHYRVGSDDYDDSDGYGSQGDALGYANAPGYANAEGYGYAAGSGNGYDGYREADEYAGYGDAGAAGYGDAEGYDYVDDGYDYVDDYDESAASSSEHTADAPAASSRWSDAFTEADVPAAEQPEAERPKTEQPKPVQPRPTQTPTPAPWPRVAAPAAPVKQVGTARRRRRVDEDAESGTAPRRLSVAEIMANLRSEENGNGGG
ncbi:DUF6779 domain-containing protein [Nocardia sp. NPDC005366]|uniref:DUF6779 domain-containing protein n=1 Tax=Nocardia sp. NPDC005366 TaxID=3156878 RepID=UPI0033BD54C9